MRGAIIYISSNRENPVFESKVVQDMLSKRGKLPVYVVSQNFMPLHMVDNTFSKIIGDVGTSGFNFCRQLQMVVEMADVDYVISCEADCLYSPNYFEFVPPKLDQVYRNTNVYLMPYEKEYWHPKSSQTAFQVAGRDFLLDRLNYLLRDQPQWNTEMKNFPKEIGEPFLEGWAEFTTDYACFGMKTGEGMRKHSASGRTKVYDLPYWGSAKEIRKRFNI